MYQTIRSGIITATKNNKTCSYVFIRLSFLSRWMGFSPCPSFNITVSYCRYRKSHCGDETVLISSYLHNGISIASKMASLHWTNPLTTPIALYMDAQGTMINLKVITERVALKNDITKRVTVKLSSDIWHYWTAHTQEQVPQKDGVKLFRWQPPYRCLSV